MNKRARFAVVGLVLLAGGGLAYAQASKSKPPVAQAWIDLATYSGMGMGGGMNPLTMLGGAFGGGGRNTFGNTMTGRAGSWLDVTLATRNNPNLAEAIQSVPVNSKLAPELKLVSPKLQKGVPVSEDDEVVREEFEPPKGKIYLYWGCGDSVRPGQPQVLDMAKASPADYQKFFVGRRATQRGAHLADGRPSWPNEQDARMVPEGASLIGEHVFKGQGVPDGFRFAIGQAQDIMPPLELNQRDRDGVTQLEWKGLPTARAYFISAMGARGDNEMVFWSSSEVPENGTGLVDYQTNSAVDRWLKEKALLAPDARTCTVPKGIFGEGAMVRMIAYGTELNLAHPPKPTNPNLVWEPQWAVKVRLKSVANAMLGMGAMGEGASGRDSTGQPRRENAKQPENQGPLEEIGQGLDKLKGVFGF
ncbi:MAG: hypothetical protein OEV89_07965 [Desulfobulbaceae bacterium]|nr:hypothetical protein [Desulfobulbaceae bacterium]HIJ90688.1 hypothetical protein [Deltaproteobacteria bacterium]